MHLGGDLVELPVALTVSSSLKFAMNKPPVGVEGAAKSIEICQVISIAADTLGGEVPCMNPMPMPAFLVAIGVTHKCLEKRSGNRTEQNRIEESPHPR